MTTMTDTTTTRFDYWFERALYDILRMKALEMIEVPAKIRADLDTALDENIRYAVEWKIAPLIEAEARKQIGDELLLLLDHEEAEYSTPTRALKHLGYLIDRWVEEAIRHAHSVDFRAVGARIRGEVALEVQRAFRYVEGDARESASELAFPGYQAKVWQLHKATQAQKERLGRARTDASKALIKVELDRIEQDRRSLQDERELHIAQAKAEVMS